MGPSFTKFRSSLPVPTTWPSIDLMLAVKYPASLSQAVSR